MRQAVYELATLRQSLNLTGRLPNDVSQFLTHHAQAPTASHSARVAAQAVILARRLGVDAEQAEAAAWLHDVSAVIPDEARLQLAEAHGLAVLPEEVRLPMLVHQKLSALLARELFGVADAAVLSAIGCHTTLKRDASALDKVVFVADKIAWDQSGEPPYLGALQNALERSLDAAAWVYLDFLWQQRSRLPVLHPWVADAYQQLEP